MADSLDRSQDMFLKLETAKQGPIKGESQDTKHSGEIDVISWSWGMESKTALAGGGASGKATLHELTVLKRVDSASTALMAAMRNNDQIKKAVLCVRKAGTTQHEYLKITIEKGRITNIKLDAGSAATSNPDLLESLSFAFQKIGVEYVPQGPDGQPRGGMLFETTMEPS
jgi:type VI secretion system secreted protein Hcp